MLKVGIIGTGKIFNLNVLGYLDREDVEITCLCNRTPEKAEKKIQGFNLNPQTTVYSDYEEMLESEDLDIVEILLPNHLHAKPTIRAAEHGIRGISVQKPMALTLDEADEMIETCERTGTILSVYENFLFEPHVKKAKELLVQDYIGDLASIRIKVALGGKGGWNVPEGSTEWRMDPSKVGGAKEEGSPVLLDNGWHAFTLGWWLFEEKIEKVFAWTGDYQGMDTPAFVMWKNEKNPDIKHVIPQFGNLEFSLMPEMEIPSDYYPTDEFIEIIGSRGLMKINQGTSIGNPMTNSAQFAPIVIYRDGKVETYEDFELDWKQGFINATHHFIDAVKGEKCPVLSAEQARYILKFNLAAIKSAESRREVFLGELE